MSDDAGSVVEILCMVCLCLCRCAEIAAETDPTCCNNCCNDDDQSSRNRQEENRRRHNPPYNNVYHDNYQQISTGQRPYNANDVMGTQTASSPYDPVQRQPTPGAGLPHMPPPLSASTQNDFVIADQIKKPVPPQNDLPPSYEEAVQQSAPSAPPASDSYYNQGSYPHKGDV